MSRYDHNSSHARQLRRRSRPFGGGLFGRGRLILALLMAAMALAAFVMSRQDQPVVKDIEFIQSIDAVQNDQE